MTRNVQDQNRQTRSGKGGALRLGEIAAGPLAEIFARQGFASREIMTRWPEIAGEAIAAHCRPIRLAWPQRRPAPGDAGEPATLELRVESAFALEAQQRVPLILERVNACLGWKAVGRVVLKQGPVAALAAAAPMQRPLPPPAPEKMRAAAAAVRDESLRAALERLGAAVAARGKQPD